MLQNRLSQAQADNDLYPNAKDLQIKAPHGKTQQQEQEIDSLYERLQEFDAAESESDSQVAKNEGVDTNSDSPGPPLLESNGSENAIPTPNPTGALWDDLTDDDPYDSPWATSSQQPLGNECKGDDNWSERKQPCDAIEVPTPDYWREIKPNW